MDLHPENNYIFRFEYTIKYDDFLKLRSDYTAFNGQTSFSTQHKTKGAEFDNVLIILDSGGWKNYNFERMFLGTASPSVMDRTRKIFYVCCTRAKEKLAVFFHNPDEQVIEKAKEWFGKENVINID